MAFNKHITSAADLVTTPEATRDGFLNFALEKNKISDEYARAASRFKRLMQDVDNPDDLLDNQSVRDYLLTASGLSDKSMQYLTDDDKTALIKELVDVFLKPAGEDFIDEAVYRYLLIKGDSVGGTMRNRIGALGEEKLIRGLIDSLRQKGLEYYWTKGKGAKTKWIKQADVPADDENIERDVKALHWKNHNGSRVLIFDLKVPLVNKNIDICLFESTMEQADRFAIKNHPEKGLMFGELKGGIDPAGADEHWKTGNTALERIRTSFAGKGFTVFTSFIGAAIETAMAEEIFGQLQNGTMSNAANLTNQEQLDEYCSWVVSI